MISVCVLQWSMTVASIAGVRSVALLPNFIVDNRVLRPFRYQVGGTILVCSRFFFFLDHSDGEADSSMKAAVRCSSSLALYLPGGGGWGGVTLQVKRHHELIFRDFKITKMKGETKK
jgi:hypothetical protein